MVLDQDNVRLAYEEQMEIEQENARINYEEKLRIDEENIRYEQEEAMVFEQAKLLTEQDEEAHRHKLETQQEFEKMEAEKIEEQEIPKPPKKGRSASRDRQAASKAIKESEMDEMLYEDQHQIKDKHKTLITLIRYLFITITYSTF